MKIANSKGAGSQEFKQRTVDRLLQDSQSAEQSRYLVRTLCQHLRIGAVKTTMLIALSRAFLLSRPPGKTFPIHLQSDLAKLKKEELRELFSKNEEIVKASFARRPNYNDLVPCLLENGVSGELLLLCGLAIHIPLRPMLGSVSLPGSENMPRGQSTNNDRRSREISEKCLSNCKEEISVASTSTMGSEPRFTVTIMEKFLSSLDTWN